MMRLVRRVALIGLSLGTRIHVAFGANSAEILDIGRISATSGKRKLAGTMLSSAARHPIEKGDAASGSYEVKIELIIRDISTAARDSVRAISKLSGICNVLAKRDDLFPITYNKPVLLK